MPGRGVPVKGRLTTADEFKEIIVRRADDGSIVRLGDVARVELSAENFETAGYLDGKPAGAMPVYQYADANALDIVAQVKAEMDAFKRSFPEGLDYTIAHDTTNYVDENIEEVQHTLLEAFGLVMLIGLETKNAILIVEFGVEMRQKHGMSIVESAKAASRERLRPILMTSFAFVMGVLPMARATGAGAYSRNSLGVVITFGMAVSTVLGRFVIPIYYVLGERVIDYFARRHRDDNEPRAHEDAHRIKTFLCSIAIGCNPDGVKSRRGAVISNDGRDILISGGATLRRAKRGMTASSAAAPDELRSPRRPATIRRPIRTAGGPGRSRPSVGWDSTAT